jgi:hypothetical protein
MDQQNEGQIGAHLRYRFAFKRMDEAMEEGWLMEAVTIQESILSGRILSALHKKGVDVDPKDSFSSLIDRFRRYFENDDSNVVGLCDHLHEWRKKRNHVLHSVCRHIDDPFDPSTVEKFEELLVAAAREGRVLVDEVRNAVARLNRKYKKIVNS